MTHRKENTTKLNSCASDTSSEFGKRVVPILQHFNLHFNNVLKSKGDFVEHSYWSSWYSGWGWFLWIGIWFLMISSFGNWGYTYRVHRRYGDQSLKTARDILNERYAKGEIQSHEFHKMKSEITANSRESDSSSLRTKITPSVNPA